MHIYRLKNRWGISLIEFLTTIAMIALLSALLLPQTTRAQTSISIVGFTESTNAAGQIILTPNASTSASGSATVAGSSTAVTLDNAASDAFTWLTSYGTNTWAGTRAYIETGAAYQNQVNVASVAKIGYEVYQINPSLSVELSSETFNAGIAGTILQETGFIGLAYNTHDVEIVPEVGGGDDFASKQGYIAVGLEVRKLLGPHWYMWLEAQENIAMSKGDGAEVGKLNPIPIVSAGFGATVGK